MNRYIQYCPKNPVWDFANRSNPAECDFERLFARVKQMHVIYDAK